MNYRTNEDKRCYTSPGFNLIDSIENISDESGEVSYPVTRSEVKDYIRIAGFDDSGEFDFDDTLIDIMIASAVARLETYTGVHFYPKTLRVYCTNGLGDLYLPGPVNGDVSVYDIDDAVLDGVQVVGGKFPKLKYPIGADLRLEYSAGYTTLPAALKLAVLMQVAYDYEHRGDDQNEVLSKKALSAAAPFVKGGFG